MEEVNGMKEEKYDNRWGTDSKRKFLHILGCVVGTDHDDIQALEIGIGICIRYIRDNWPEWFLNKQAPQLRAIYPDDEWVKGLIDTVIDEWMKGLIEKRHGGGSAMALPLT